MDRHYVVNVMGDYKPAKLQDDKCDSRGGHDQD
jgi:hypothetical protein